MGVCVMENIQHCISVARKKQMNILVRKESLNFKDSLNRVVVKSNRIIRHMLPHRSHTM